MRVEQPISLLDEKRIPSPSQTMEKRANGYTQAAAAFNRPGPGRMVSQNKK